MVRPQPHSSINKWDSDSALTSLLASQLHPLRSRPHSNSDLAALRICLHHGSMPHIFTLLHIFFMSTLWIWNSLSYFVSASTCVPEHWWDLHILLYRILESMKVCPIYVTVHFLTDTTLYSSPTVAFTNCHMEIVESHRASLVSFLSEQIQIQFPLDIVV
jgi:hypothetical protein